MKNKKEIMDKDIEKIYKVLDKYEDNDYKKIMVEVILKLEEK